MNSKLSLALDINPSSFVNQIIFSSLFAYFFSIKPRMPNPAFQSVAQLVYFISVIHVLTIRYAGPECKNCGNIFPSRAYFKMLKQKGLLKK